MNEGEALLYPAGGIGIDEPVGETRLELALYDGKPDDAMGDPEVEVIGQRVVDTAIVLVLITVLDAGQFVTDSAHDVIVNSVVE